MATIPKEGGKRGVLPLIAVVGPTAAGKTKLAILLAQKIGGEIISADSMQVYRRMDIGTAKIKPAEMGDIPHHLIDIREPDEPFSVFDFQQLAEIKIREICARGHIPIIVGGTGLYINSVIDGYTFKERDEGGVYREKINKLARKHGPERLHSLLAEVDPPSAQKIHPHNAKKVKRALEYYFINNERISDNISEHKQKESSAYNLSLVGLNRERERLYELIHQRVEIMLREGLLEEVTSLLQAGYAPELQSMQGLGYKQLAAFLSGRCDFAGAIEALKRDTRNYAKRQLTWFRRDPRLNWVDLDKYGSAEEALIEILSIVGRTIKLNVE